jgi:3-deoxy-D-manno-octulosonic-acid transferase
VPHVVLALYRVIGTILLPVLVIAILVRSIKQPDYRRRIFERLGFCRKPKAPGGIIIHGSSLGEIASLKSFIEGILARFPNHPVIVTCFTPAGSQHIKRLFGERVIHSYLPFDSMLCNAIFLARTKPSAMIFMETELWPSLALQTKKKGAKLVLINARLSDNSVRHYPKIGALMRLTLNSFDAILAQSFNNQQRFAQLGASESTLSLVGNIKYDITANVLAEQKAKALKTLLNSRFIWVVGSSHEDEEKLLLDTFESLKRHCPQLLLILVPRHPERFAPLACQMAARNFIVVRQSANQQPSDTTDIWLVDTIGELLMFYAIADICTVAGSFDNTGGHNPLEPALFGKPTTVGPNMRNAQELVIDLLAADAIIQHKNAETLVTDIIRLIENPEARRKLGDRAAIILKRNQGATERCLIILEEMLNGEINSLRL